MDSDLLGKALSVVIGAGSGVKLLADAFQAIHARSVAATAVRQLCHETRSFSLFRFRTAAFLVLGIVGAVALLLTVLAICATVILVGTALQWSIVPNSIRRLVTFPNLAAFGGLSFVLFVFGTIVLSLEQSISFRRVNWLVGVAEQTLADRLRRGEEGIFRVDDDRCERLAESIHAKLQREPAYISGALLEPHNDRARLANELVVGGLLEGVASYEHREFGGDWSGYRPIQDHLWNGRPILGVESIRQTEPRELAAGINAFFKGRRLALPLTVEGLLEDLLRRLRVEWQGDALRLFSFSKPPWMDLAYGCIAGAALCGIGALMLSRAGLMPWPFGAGQGVATVAKRKSSRFPVWSMTPRMGHRCAITRRCNDERRDPPAPV